MRAGPAIRLTFLLAAAGCGSEGPADRPPRARPAAIAASPAPVARSPTPAAPEGNEAPRASLLPPVPPPLLPTISWTPLPPPPPPPGAKLGPAEAGKFLMGDSALKEIIRRAEL